MSRGSHRPHRLPGRPAWPPDALAPGNQPRRLRRRGDEDAYVTSCGNKYWRNADQARPSSSNQPRTNRGAGSAPIDTIGNPLTSMACTSCFAPKRLLRRQDCGQDSAKLHSIAVLESECNLGAAAR